MDISSLFIIVGVIFCCQDLPAVFLDKNGSLEGNERVELAEN